MSEQGTDPLERVMVGMKNYIDGEVAKVRDEFATALQGHVFAINELQDAVGGLQTEVTLSMAFDGDAYRKFVVEECARLGVKPSDVMKAKLELTRDVDAEGDDDGTPRPK